MTEVARGLCAVLLATAAAAGCSSGGSKTSTCRFTVQGSASIGANIQ